MITVIGHDGGQLSPDARAVLDAAGCVAGTARHLDALPVPAGARRITMGPLGPALDAVGRWDGAAVVVASGDPGFFGIVRALRARGVVPRVLPAVSSVALAFARLGLPWDDALVLSAHGRSPEAALAAALAHPKAAILTAPGAADAARFVRPLLEAGRAVYVAERLGGPDERVLHIDATDAGDRSAGVEEASAAVHPNVVIAVDERRVVSAEPGWLAGHQGAPDGWALPEAEFTHRDGMITKTEVRALALGRLAPRPGTVVWDIGAGSGSVAVECARFGAYVLAFEKDPDGCARIRENAVAHGVHVDVVEGTVPGSFGGRPDPDAVFLGGGGVEALEAVVPAERSPGAPADGAPVEGVPVEGVPAAALAGRRRPRRVVAVLAAVDRVRAVRDLLAARGYAPTGTALQASRLADLPDDAIRLTATNPVFVLWGERS